MEKRRQRRTPWAIVLLVLLVCVFAAYGVGRLCANSFATRTLGHTKAVDIANIQDLQATNTGFVYYDGSTVSAINSAGGVQWSYLVGANAGFKASDSGVAAWSGQTITLIDGASGSTIFNGTMADNVVSAYVGDKYTAILIGEESNGTIVIMENGGRQVNQIPLDSVTAVDYGFFSNESLLWVMVLDSNGTVPKCTIQTYRPGKEIVGSISDNEQLAYAVMFQSSRVCIVGDTFLKVYDYSGTEDTSKRELVYGWYLSSADKRSSDPLMVFVNDAQCKGDSDIRDVRLLRSDVDRVVRMPFGCKSVVAVGSTVYGFSSDGHLMILPASAGEAQAYQINLHIDEVYGVTGDGVAVVRSGGTVYLVNLV